MNHIGKEFSAAKQFVIVAIVHTDEGIAVYAVDNFAVAGISQHDPGLHLMLAGFFTKLGVGDTVLPSTVGQTDVHHLPLTLREGLPKLLTIDQVEPALCLQSAFVDSGQRRAQLFGAESAVLSCKNNACPFSRREYMLVSVFRALEVDARSEEKRGEE